MLSGRWPKRMAIGMFSILLIGHALAQAAEDAKIVKDFQDRANKYLELHKQQGVGGKPSESSNKLAQQKQAAREKIRSSRPAARQGDIFTPEIGAYFKKQIAATMQGPDGPKIRASLRHAEPLPHVNLKVNARYPTNLPLQSTPPTLLLNLPHLPGKLQYRIVDSTLVLYDVDSGLIVDFLPEAVPPVGAETK